MGTNDRSVQFAGDTLGRQRHICAFFNSADEEHRVLRPFIKEGLDRGEKAFHIVDPELREAHLKKLAEAGVGVEHLVEYEARLNYVLPKYDDPVICAYDLSKFAASVAMDVMRTHPVVIVGGVLQENPFFVPPDQFLLELRERRSGRKSA